MIENQKSKIKNQKYISKIKNIIVLSIFILICFFILFKNLVKDNKTRVRIGKVEFRVEMARTAEEKAKGLARHKPLLENEGMLFEFGPSTSSGSTSFWMKGMTFPIDIIWIKNNKVIYVVQNAEPPKPGQKDSELRIFMPPEGANYVLEVGAGEVKKTNIKINDQVKIQM